MDVRFAIFLTTMCSFLLGSGYYLGFRITSELSPSYAYMVWVAVYAVIILQIAGPFFYRAIPDKNNRFFILRWIMFSCMGIGSSLLLYTLMADSAVFGLNWIFPAGAAYASKLSITLALTMVGVTNIVGFGQVVKGPKIYDIKVPLPPHLAALDGFRLVQVSDLHVGPTIGKAYAERVVQIVNSLNGDIVALTGDLVDGSLENLRDDVSPLRNLRGRVGTFGVLGNHEFYWRADLWLREFSDLGIKMLNNEHQVIEFNGQKIALAGVPDIHVDRISDTMKSDPSLAIKNAPPGAYKILLAHQPASYVGACEAGFDLQLSGHTHGGQFFPFTILVGLAQKFVKGLHRHKNLWIYVNRGTGYWGPPVRFLVPPEITLITLTRSEIETIS